MEIITGSLVYNAIKNLPKLVEGATALNNNFLLKKINAFLEERFEGDDEAILEFVNGIDQSDWTKAQDLIIHNINHAEFEIKSIYLKRLFNALLKKEISLEEFWKMSFILQQVYAFDFTDLLAYGYGKSLFDSQLEKFHTHGLLDRRIEFNKESDDERAQVLYVQNDFGRKLIGVILHDEKERRDIKDKKSMSILFDL